jgi:hypothetical protein
MPLSVKYDPQDHLIAIRCTEWIDPDQVRQAAVDAAQLALQHECYLVLDDARGARPAFSPIEIYQLPDMIKDILAEAGISVARMRRALVVSNDLEDFRFFETVSRNRAHDVLLFQDLDEARAWLLGT